MTAPVAPGREMAAAADELITRLLARPEARRAAHTEGRSDAMWPALVEVGLFSICVPDSAGGLGFGLATLIDVAAVFGQHLIPGQVIEQIVAPAILLPVADGPARDLLSSAADGSATLAVVDPNACGAPDDELKLDEDRLNGRCELVRFAAQADLLVVVALSPVGPALAVVDSNAAGIRIIPLQSMDPLISLAIVEFDDVRVSAVGGRSELALRLRSTLRVAFAAEMAGLARNLLDESVRYAKQRHQFGRPIGSFQAVQHILAEMCVDVLGLEALCNEVAGRGFDRLDETTALVVNGRASAVARSVGEQALQVHGGIAFTAEYELQRWFVHALSLQALYGDERASALALGLALARGEIEPWS